VAARLKVSESVEIPRGIPQSTFEVTPMPTKSTPTLRRHKSSGHAYARFDGHQIWFGRHDDPRSHQDFAEYLIRWQTGDGKPFEGDASTTTVAVLVARYLDHATIYYRRAGGRPTGTVDAIRYAVRRGDDCLSCRAHLLPNTWEARQPRKEIQMPAQEPTPIRLIAPCRLLLFPSKPNRHLQYFLARFHLNN
jgi:hypothetical protein